MTNEEFESMQQEMTSAFSTVLSKYEQSFVTKWIAIIEVIDAEDGNRSLWQLGSNENKAWDSKGMLQQALDWERARTISAVLNAEED